MILAWVLMAWAMAAELVVWHAYRGAEEQALQQAADTWSADSGHEVSLNAVPFGAFDSKLETAIPRGNGPDVFIAGHSNLGKWARMGIVVPTPELKTAKHRPATVQALQWDGAGYGLPLAFKSVVLLYDPTVVKAPPETTTELLAQAKAFTGDGKYGLVFQASEAYFHAPWMHAFGAATLDENGVNLDTQGHVDAFRFSRRLAADEGIAPAQPTAELVARLYREGNAAFVISGPWFVADMERPIAAAPLPFVDEAGAPARPYLTVEGVFLADQAKNPDGARSFMRYLAGPAGARIRQDLGGQAVSHASVTSSDPLLAVLAEQAEVAVAMPSDPDVLNAFEALNRSLRRVQRGAVTPEQAAREAQTYYKVLARPPPPPAPVAPYLAILVLGLLALVGWLAYPLLDPDERADIWAHRWDYIWILPAGAALIVLVVLPFVTGATVSLFAHHKGEWTFVGIRHFVDILLARDWPVTSPLSFAYTLVVTVLWTVSNLTLHVAIGVALALVLREPWVRMRAVWRALLIIPWAVPNYITALIWKGMFHAQYGAINALLGIAMLSDQPAQIDWFGSFATSFAANLATNTWLGFPFMMVITLGALQSIPRDLEEAAEVDGAGWLFRFRLVVWPLLRPALLPAVILGSVWTFNMFNIIYLVSAGEPDSSTEILISEAYRWAFTRNNRYGYAAAYAVLIFGVLLIYSRGANRLVGKKVL